jgi:endonuclease-3
MALTVSAELGREPEAKMTKDLPGLAKILDRLEEHYGRQNAVGPSEAYEMILFVNSAYPATDVACAKGYDALRSEVGTRPEEILKAPKGKLLKPARLGGMFPEKRVERWKSVARMAEKEFGGDLDGRLEKLMKDEKTPKEKRLKAAKNAMKKFPVIGEPRAEKILLFAGLAPVAAVPSACTGVPQRILFGHEDKNYAKGYRAAQDKIAAAVPEEFAARRRAYWLLKKHGQEICKRTRPKCEICPISGMCAYFWKNG